LSNLRFFGTALADTGGTRYQKPTARSRADCGGPDVRNRPRQYRRAHRRRRTKKIRDSGCAAGLSWPMRNSCLLRSRPPFWASFTRFVLAW